MNWKLQTLITVILTVFSSIAAEGIDATTHDREAVGVWDILKGVIGDVNVPEARNPTSVRNALEKIIGQRNAAGAPNNVDAGTQGDSSALGAQEKPAQDDPRAAYELGIAYLQGLGDTRRDVPKALELLGKSAGAGHGDAMLRLAAVYRRGDGVARDEGLATKWLRKAAEAGKGIAMLQLAANAYRGRKAVDDEQERIQWTAEGLKSLEAAAGNGDCDAMRSLGIVYQPVKRPNEGTAGAGADWLGEALLCSSLPGMEKDESKSAEWYRRAVAGYEKRAARGDAEAMYWLGKSYGSGRGLEEDVTRESYWYRKAAEAGHGGAMVELGWACHREGDFENAVKWFRKAAEQGESEAMTSLGWLYGKGDGVPRDGLEAVKWWREAADRGDSAAMLALGAAYASGEGVTQDYRQAFMWYERGADVEDVTCLFSLGLMYLTGRGVVADRTKAIECWLKGAKKEDAGCMANLGWAYLNGQGVQRDRDRGIHWLQEAALLGNEYARRRLAEINGIK